MKIQKDQGGKLKIAYIYPFYALAAAGHGIIFDKEKKIGERSERGPAIVVCVNKNNVYRLHFSPNFILRHFS